jgi:hypothetical protein
MLRREFKVAKIYIFMKIAKLQKILGSLKRSLLKRKNKMEYFIVEK